jgi:transaldolase
MKPTQQLHDLGQSLWLDNITRGLLKDGTLRRYIEELSITGLTSNPSIFDHAIKESNFYDDAIHQKVKQGKSGEALFFELAIEDLRQAADLFRPVYDRTNGIDGWVSDLLDRKDLRARVDHSGPRPGLISITILATLESGRRLPHRSWR